MTNFHLPIKSTDDIDLFAIWHALSKQKFLIAGMVAICLAGALVYLSWVKPVYEVHSTLRPAELKELDELNRSGIYSLPPAAALAKVAVSLRSYDSRLAFFTANQQLFQPFMSPGRTLEQNFEWLFLQALTVTEPPVVNDEVSRSVGLTFKYPSGLDGALILNRYVDFVIANQRLQIALDLKVMIDNRLREIDGKLDAARSEYRLEKSAKIALLLERDAIARERLQDELQGLRLELKMQRKARIEKLDEAISIARNLGLTKPGTPSSLASETIAGAGNVFKTEVNSQQLPLYFIGVEALEAEKAALQRRVTDDFSNARVAAIAKELQMLQVNREVENLKKRSDEDKFLNDAQAWRSEAARLNALKTEFGDLALISVDQKALEPESPVSPKRWLVLAVAVALGLMLGGAFALARYSLGVMRRQAQGNALKFVEVKGQGATLAAGETTRIQ
ncbi:Wzz/FepE/Etk N-terminal domain-containing protein [Pseudomonas sp. CAM1A]|uniref:Wzz/FepE/Etk N-terminal domain-containing protein n=1 Tax=Pseudomonas sp. CAM1A TaxID=3231717 RepID=UPI0039C6542C